MGVGNSKKNPSVSSWEAEGFFLLHFTSIPVVDLAEVWNPEPRVMRAFLPEPHGPVAAEAVKQDVASVQEFTISS